MQQSLEMLVQQIQRLLISDADRQRVIDELASLSASGKQELAQLVHDHDEEALEILNKKSAEVQQVKERLQDAFPTGVPELSDEEVKTVARQLKEAFGNPEQLAQLIAVSDDLMLAKLEEVMLAGVAHDPSVVQECKDFFKEVRLQRMAFVKADEKKQKEALIEAVTQQKEQLDHMDQLIAKAEKVMGKKYGK